MPLELHKGYPNFALEDSYAPLLTEDIGEGMFVVLDANGQLVKAVGAANEYAMITTNAQPDATLQSSTEYGGKCQVIKENASLGTTFFITDTYAPHDRLMVSQEANEAGFIKKHDNGGAPVVGRFLFTKVIRNKTYLFFDLVRS